MVSIDLSSAGALLSYIMGLIVAIAFPLGAILSLFMKYPNKLRSNIVAFGSGVSILQ